jgi:flagellar hook-associated protein 2
MATTSITSGSTSSTAASSAGTTLTAAQISAANKANAQKIISSLGAGSGVDVASLAQNLVNAEKVPQENAINSKIVKNDSKVSGLSSVMFMMSELKNALTALKDKDNFNTLTVNNTNTNAFNVTASTSAAAGDHQVVVNAISRAQLSVSPSSPLATTSLNSGNAFSLTLTATNSANVGITKSYGTYTASINAPAFGTVPSVNDFKNFTVGVDGKTFNLTPAPATATLNDLATDIQKQLRAQDGSSDLSVVYDGTNINITSATTTRVVTNPALSQSTKINLDTGANAGVNANDSITGATFGSIPSVNDFSQFDITIGGTARTIYPSPSTASMTDLAANIQSQLRSLDGNNDISVSYDSTNGLKVSSTSSKTLTGIGLTKKIFSDTPEGVVAAINNSNRGYKAQLIDDGTTSPFKVIVTGANGATEGFTISSDDALGTFGSGFTVPTGYAAADASVTVDGLTYTRKTNAVSDIVPGLTLNLKAVSTTPASINLSRDTSDLKTKITALVTAYNDFDNIIKETTNPKSTLATYGSTLVGDNTVRMVRQQMRSLIFGISSTPGSTYKSLSQIGFSLDQTGVLSLDSAKLDSALSTGVDDIAKMFTGGYNKLSTFAKLPAGIAGDAVKKLTDLLAPTGALLTKSDNANKENTSYQTQLAKLQTRMDALLARYQKQFAAMDSMVGSTNSQKTSLKSTFDGMMATYTNK